MTPFAAAALVSLIMVLAGCGGGTAADTVTPSAPSPNPSTSGGPSSSELIDGALAKGEIDSDTALKYQVFATFNDSRLPTNFKGDDGGIFESDALQELNTRFDSLSIENQAALAAYLLRPSSIGSWANPGTAIASSSSRMTRLSRPNCSGESKVWAELPTANQKAKVWYQPGVKDDLKRATVVADAIDTKIWPILVGTLGFKEPPDDTHLLECDGLDARLDIYLVSNVNFRGQTMPEGFDPYQGPSYIMLNRDALVSDDSLRAGVTHEIMHAIQWAYRTASRPNTYGWMRDAMANWAIDQVYKQSLQLEQEYADCFTSTPELSLDDRSSGHCQAHQPPRVNRDYGAYLFFQFIARTLTPATVEKVLSATFSNATSLEAVESSIPGGFKEQWPKFAKTLWNQAPIETRPASFRQWDGLTETPKKSPNGVSLNGDLNGEPNPFKLAKELSNLSSRYYHFTFSDPNTRSILFYNGFFEQIKAGKAIKIMAFWKDATGTWQEEPLDDPTKTSEDWSKYKYVGLCRDIKMQGASELTIIVTNAEKEPNGKVVTSLEPYLKRSKVGCLKYEGQATSNFKDLTWSGLGAKVVSSKLTFELDPKMRTLDAKNPTVPDSLRVGLGLPMTLTGADFTYEDSHDQDACSFTLAPTPFSFLDGFTVGFLFINPFEDLESTDPVNQKLFTMAGSYFGIATDVRPGNLLVASPKTADCIGQASRQGLGALLTTSESGLSTFPIVKPSGTLQDNANTPTGTYSWTLSPKSEP